MSAQQLVSALHTYGRLNLLPGSPELMNELLALAAVRLRKLQPRSVVDLAWALGRLHQSDRALAAGMWAFASFFTTLLLVWGAACGVG